MQIERLPRIELPKGMKFVGRHARMSLANDRTFELWNSFMPRRNEVGLRAGSELFSIGVYPPLYFVNFDPSAEFEKWAAVRVTDVVSIPDGMETIASPEGAYAVFKYTGLPSDGGKAFDYIFGTWLPNSGYVLEERPHYAVMGEKYRNGDPASEEELWLPVRLK